MSSQPKESGRIVVGVDGSKSSKEALRWAVRQAEATVCSVNAVIAWEYPPLYGSIGWLDDTDTRGGPEGVGRPGTRRLHQRGRESERRFAGRGNRGIRNGRSGAAGGVVGSRGQGGFSGALLGSVSQHCTQHAPCPVVVVRGRDR